jgi:hypothetical protein|tara:strand:+ start:1285 stop:1767 length:483 start_codon:yes stop_codon:yes gene_type:complete
MSEMEMRYWPRLGIYVTKVDAESYISKVGEGHTHLDDDIEEFVPVSSPEPDALRIEVETLFNNPPTDAPAPSEEIKQMLAVIEFEENRVATIKKWIKEDGMEKQDAKDRFQAEMDVMVREALGLPDETEHEKEYREKAATIAAEREEHLAANNDAEDEEE